MYGESFPRRQYEKKCFDGLGLCMYGIVLADENPECKEVQAVVDECKKKETSGERSSCINKVKTDFSALKNKCGGIMNLRNTDAKTVG